MLPVVVVGLRVGLLLLCRAPADFDADGDVDQADFAVLQRREGAFTTGSDPTDLNQDGKIDTQDLGLLIDCASGPGVPAAEDCSSSRHVEVWFGGMDPVHNYPIKLQLNQKDLRFPLESVGFQQQGKPLDHWLMDRTSQSGTFWVRTHVLMPGPNLIEFAQHDSVYQPRSYAARVDGRDTAASNSNLPTWKKENDGVTNIKTVHPTLTVASGWAAKLTDDGEAVLDRVLIDTPWPERIRAGRVVLGATSTTYQPEDFEVPSVWVHRTADAATEWIWPVSNPRRESGWVTDGRNEIGEGLTEDPPPVPMARWYYDPDAVWVEAQSLPSGGPATDSLFCFVFRFTGTRSQLSLIRLASPAGDAGSWASVRIEEQATDFDLRTTDGSSLVSPAVVRLADGSFLLFVAKYASAAHPSLGSYIVQASLDGLHWVPYGQFRLPLPPGLNGTWHDDVIRCGQKLFLMGSCGQRNRNGPDNLRGAAYMWESTVEAPTEWRLILPAVVGSPGPQNTEWEAGVYRPCLLYTESGGLEIGIGSSDVEVGRLRNGGFYYFKDPDWSPNAPRDTEAPSTVFWMIGRDFTIHEWDGWPSQLWRAYPSSSGTAVVSGDWLQLNTANGSNVWLESRFPKSTDHEAWVKWRQDARCGFAFWQAADYYGLYSSTRTDGSANATIPGREVGLYWPRGTYKNCPRFRSGLALGGGASHIWRAQIMKGVVQAWCDGAALTEDGQAESTVSYLPTIPSNLQDGPHHLFGAAYGDNSNTTVEIDWLFYKDVVEPEPVVSIVSGP